MENSQTNKNTGKGKLLLWIVLGLFVAFVLFVLLYQKNETAPTGKGNEVSYGGLICKRYYDKPGDVFTTSNADKIEETVNVIYRNDELDSFLFTYEGTYANKALAENGRTALLGTYYESIGKRGIKTGDYTFSSSVGENTAMLTFRVGARNIRYGILSMLFLDDNLKISEYSREDFQRDYERVGFSCKNEN